MDVKVAASPDTSVLPIAGRARWRPALALAVAAALTTPLLSEPANAQTTKKSTNRTTKSTTKSTSKSTKSSSTGPSKATTKAGGTTTKAAASATTTKTTSSSVSGTADANKTTTKAGSGSTTTADVRPVTETTKPKSTGSTTIAPAAKATKGPVFIPGAGRVLDLGAAEVAKLANGGRAEVDVRGQTGLAASGSGSVIVDITVTNPTSSGRVTLTPVAPEFARSVVSSSVAFQPGATTVSRVIVPVGSGGALKIATSAGPSGLTIAVVGWVITAPAGSTEPSAIAMDPCKILDTATGLGGLSGEITSARPFDIPAVGIAKVPAALAATGPTPLAVILHVTAANASGPLELRVVPTGSESPELKLQMNAGQTSSANFIVPVGADGRAAFYVSAAGTNIAVEVVGWIDRDNAVKSGGPC